MIRFLLISFLLMTSCWAPPALARPGAKVLKIRGNALFNGKPVTNGQALSNSGELIVSKSSFVKIVVSDWGNTITIGPRSKFKLKIKETNGEQAYSLISGAARWITQKVNKSSKKGSLQTSQASFGVRGTDFLVKANSLLGESEIIVFSGLVEFLNTNKRSDKQNISKNQWGGLGGRFGSEIGKVLDLPSSVISHFDKMLKI